MRSPQQKLFIVGIFVAAALTAVATYSSSSSRVSETAPRLVVESKSAGQLVDSTNKDNMSCCPR